MKSKFMSFLSLTFPWVVFLIKDNPGGALLALVLQASVIGWIPASVWAWRTVHEKTKKRAQKETQFDELD